MHEMSVAQSLFDAVMEALDDYPEVNRVVRVRVKVGRLSCIVPDSLNLCFSIFARNTLADNAQLEIERVPAMVRCRNCGRESEIDPASGYVCPHCESLALDILSGQELFIDSMDVE